MEYVLWSVSGMSSVSIVSVASVGAVMSAQFGPFTILFSLLSPPCSVNSDESPNKLNSSGIFFPLVFPLGVSHEHCSCKFKIMTVN